MAQLVGQRRSPRHLPWSAFSPDLPSAHLPRSVQCPLQAHLCNRLCPPSASASCKSAPSAGRAAQPPSAAPRAAGSTSTCTARLPARLTPVSGGGLVDSCAFLGLRPRRMCAALSVASKQKLPLLPILPAREGPLTRQRGACRAADRRCRAVHPSSPALPAPSRRRVGALLPGSLCAGRHGDCQGRSFLPPPLGCQVRLPSSPALGGAGSSGVLAGCSLPPLACSSRVLHDMHIVHSSLVPHLFPEGGVLLELLGGWSHLTPSRSPPPPTQSKQAG